MDLFLVTLVRERGVSMADVESTLNRAHDWFRVQKDTWIIVSRGSAEVWSNRLRDSSKQVLVIRIDSGDPNDLAGWLPKSFWEWLDETGF